MTTKETEKRYDREHINFYDGQSVAVFNPHNKPVEKLPTIFGFNRGGEPGFMFAQLISEDGTHLGSHCCSSEAYMPADLGILENTRPDRHEHFREYYPDGYKMRFVSPDDTALSEAISKYQIKEGIK